VTARAAAIDPLAELAAWLELARQGGDPAPDAMTLATATPDGVPSARIVLFRGLRAGAIRFFTSYEGRKAGELEANPRAALLFHWKALRRQVRAEGSVARLPAAESDEYFAGRPRGHQLATWASPQSRPIESMGELRAWRDGAAERWAGRPVPRPPHWGGYAVHIDRVELWQSGADRLHERRLFERAAQGWLERLLAP
jgi:pyridoxamine 5'-phosphate oxidase